MTKYPTPWQRKTMWATLTAVFIVVLITIACSVIWLVANGVSFLQPILIPVAIAVILAYLLDPLVTQMSERGLGRTKAVFALFAIAFLSITALVAWLAPVVSMQATNVGRELPQYTLKARDTIVDLIFKYDHAFGGPSTKRDKISSPTTSLLNWLFASPSPSRKPSPTPAPSPVDRRSATSSARCCGSGSSVQALSDTGSSRSASAENDNLDSASAGRDTRTVNPRLLARSIPSRQTVVLPIPASPSKTTAA